jgi:hypothetical protein
VRTLLALALLRHKIVLGTPGTEAALVPLGADALQTGARALSRTSATS